MRKLLTRSTMVLLSLLSAEERHVKHVNYYYDNYDNCLCLLLAFSLIHKLFKLLLGE